MDWLTSLTLFVLGVFTIRDLVASMGNLPRNKWYSKFIYGNYDENLLEQVLTKMGYSSNSIQEVKKAWHKNANEVKNLGLNEKNVLIDLLSLMCNYTMYFSEKILFGTDENHSNYYINTMEASMDDESLKKMTKYLVLLISKEINYRPEVIFVPKGGNVILAQSIAKYYNAQLVVIKDKDDSAKVRFIDESNKDIVLKVNFEGAWNLFSGKKKKSIIIDCNTTSGAQLLRVLEEAKKAVEENNFKVCVPKDIFIMFRIDNINRNIDEEFNTNGCKLHRYFDVNETCKEALNSIKTQYDAKERNIFNSSFKSDLNSLLSEFKRNSYIKTSWTKE